MEAELAWRDSYADSGEHPMMQRIILLCGSTALIVAVTAADLQAAWYRGPFRRSNAARRAVSRRVVTRRAVKATSYPRVRQIDGKTLWGLGKQKGQWPTLP